MNETKPFEIDKRLVYEAFKKVRSNLNDKLVKFVKRKYKRFAGGRSKLIKAKLWLSKVASFDRNLFVHWTYLDFLAAMMTLMLSSLLIVFPMLNSY